jgi:hypothetical protein
VSLRVQCQTMVIQLRCIVAAASVFQIRKFNLISAYSYLSEDLTCASSPQS